MPKSWVKHIGKVVCIYVPGTALNHRGIIHHNNRANLLNSYTVSENTLTLEQRKRKLVTDTIQYYTILCGVNMFHRIQSPVTTGNV